MNTWLALLLLVMPVTAWAGTERAVEARQDQRADHPDSPAAEVGPRGTAADIPALQRALERARGAGHKRQVVRVGRELVQALRSAGRYREALEAAQAISAVDEEITREDRERALLELRARYDSERKTREIQRLSAENRAREAEIAARAWRERLWAVLVLAFALAAILLVQWLARSRAATRRLEDANAHLARGSSRDPLTGACTRDRFEELMAQLARDGATVGLMVLDLDHFKQINDRFGHKAGDAVLVEIARRLRGLLREQDTVVRWGGEEFVLVLPGATAHGMERLAGRVLRVIGGEPVRHDNQAVPVTVSGGCVAHPLAPGRGWKEAFRLADAALYLAKQSGRNRAACIEAIDAGVDPEQAALDLLATEQSGALRLMRIAGPPVEPAISLA